MLFRRHIETTLQSQSNIELQVCGLDTPLTHLHLHAGASVVRRYSTTFGNIKYGMDVYS